VRERLIPKRGGKVRRLGIATVADRVVQAALKLVLEPIFEADFQPCSYGFRPERRVQDAIAEVHFFASHSYEWVLEGDITACFDEISHSALLGRVRDRIGDKRVLVLVKAFLSAGVLSEDGAERDTITGTPQGGSSHRCSATSRSRPSTSTSPGRGRRWGHRALASGADARGWPTSGWCGTRTTLSSWWPAPARMPRACAPRSQRSWPRWACACRRPRRGSSTSTRALSSWGSVSSGIPGEARRNATSTPTRPRLPWRPSRRRCGRRLDKARTNRSLPCCAGSTRCCGDGPTTSGMGCPRQPSTTCAPFVWRRVVSWLRRKHPRMSWEQLRRRYLPAWWPAQGETMLLDPARVLVTRYRWRGDRIPSPWAWSERTRGTAA
jgi:RNA-directed DNA polymerase